MLEPTGFTAAQVARVRVLAAQLCAVACLQLLSADIGRAQNITNVVAPGGSVDLLNNTGNHWYFFSAPSPGGASMARVSSDLVSVYTWPDPANFTADANDSLNRIFPGEYLRVYAGSLAVNTVIQIQYATPLPGNGPYYFYVTVANAPYVTAINITDPSPTVAASVHWAVTFSAPISGVTAANFNLTNPDGLSGATITGVSGSGANWVVTASTGTGTGLLGCNYIGHASESPAVPASFTGQQYTFSQYPLITTEPASSNIVTGTSYTLTVAATIRGGGGVNYQWYAGTSVNPSAATAISGATSASYTVSGLAAGSSHQYFCRTFNAANTAYTTDSTTATVAAFNPVQIVGNPAGTLVAQGQTAMLTVTVLGTAPQFQWYQGNSGDMSTPVGTDIPAFTTPALSVNTNYWVLVYNGLPAAYNQNSTTATIRVITSLTGNGPLAALTNDAFLPAPAFLVQDSAGVPVTNYPVSLTVHSNSAGGSFSGVSSITTASDVTGVASAAFTANGVTGTYTISAAVGSVVSNIIALRNVAPLAVSTLADEDNGSIDPTLGAGTSLREAVNYAGAHPGAHSITFAAGLGGGAATMITLTNGPLSLAGTTTIAGLTNGGLVLNGSFASRIFTIAGGANVGLNYLTLTNAHSDVNDWGGALINSGTLGLTNCTLTDNAVDGGGAGGAIENFGVLILSGCTLYGNTAGFAGAIRNDSFCTLQNCTFYNNTAPANGGAIDNVFGATLNVLNCTFAGNRAGSLGGAIDNYLSTVNLTNCILALNSSQDVFNWSGSTITTGGPNLVESLVNSGGTNNGPAVIVADPLLAPFGQYGGPTQTLPPQAGSPAIDAGLDSVTNLLTTDQRGYPRLAGAHVDLGAVEGAYQPAAPLQHPNRLGNGQFQFSFTNLSGPAYTVLAGTNLYAPLNTWSNLGPAVEAPPGSFHFSDPQATNYPRRFYRVQGP